MAFKDTIMSRIRSLTSLDLSSSKENGEEAITRSAGTYGVAVPNYTHPYPAGAKLNQPSTQAFPSTQGPSWAPEDGYKS